MMAASIRSIEDRYRTDAEFHSLVDVLRAWLSVHPNYTPTELREAALLAATLHEFEHVRPIVLDRTEWPPR